MSFNDILNISNNSRNIMKYLLGNDNGNQVVKMIDVFTYLNERVMWIKWWVSSKIENNNVTCPKY